MVEKKLVVVALVEVELRAVKFCKVVEPTTKRSPEELMVEVAEPPMESELPVKRFEKKLVEVALVEVELAAIKEPVLSMVKRAVPAALRNFKKLPVKEGVEEALIKVPVVPVAFTWKRAERSSEAVVVAPTTKDFSRDEVAERKSPEAISSRAWPKPAEPLSSASQPKSPPDQVRTLFEVQEDNPAPLKLAVKRLEEEAVVEKREVVVAEVVVLFPVIKRLAFIVELEVERKPFRKPRVVEVETPHD